MDKVVDQPTPDMRRLTSNITHVFIKMNEAESKSIPSVPPKPLRMHTHQAKDTTEVYIARTRFQRYYTITESPHFNQSDQNKQAFVKRRRRAP